MGKRRVSTLQIGLLAASAVTRGTTAPQAPMCGSPLHQRRKVVSFSNAAVTQALISTAAAARDSCAASTLLGRWKGACNIDSRKEGSQQPSNRCPYCFEIRERSLQPCPCIRTRQGRLRDAQLPYMPSDFVRPPQTPEEALHSALDLRKEVLSDQTLDKRSRPRSLSDELEEYHLTIHNRIRAKNRAKAKHAEALGLYEDGSNCLFGGSTLRRIGRFLARAGSLVGF